MQLSTERFVALKVLEKKLDSNPEYFKIAKKEMKILLELSHPHVI